MSSPPSQNAISYPPFVFYEAQNQVRDQASVAKLHPRDIKESKSRRFEWFDARLSITVDYKAAGAVVSALDPARHREFHNLVRERKM